MAKKWTLLAYKELSADATTLDTADGVIQGTGSYFSKSRSLHVVMWGASASGGATNAILRFGDETNGIDSGSSYKWVRFRGNTSGAPSKQNQSSATTSFYDSIFVAGNSGIDTWHFIEFDIDNTETQYKGVNSRTMRTNDSSLANALETQWTSGEWSKTDRQCQRIQLTGSGGDSEYASGTGIAVYGYIDDTVSDEKTTLADGTRESTATKTAPTSGVLPTGTTTTDWTLTNTTISSSKLNFNAGQQSTAVNGLYDLGSALSDEKWVVRFKYVISDYAEGNASNINAFVGLFSTTGNFNSTQDSINLGLTNWASNVYFWANAEADGSIDESSSTGRLSTTPSETTYYVEIARTGTTTGKITLFSDSTYETELSSQTTFLNGVSSSITGLRYIGIKNRSNVPTLGSARWEGTISDIEVYDGVDAVVSTVSTAPEAGTRYEEVDTRKIYRFTSSGTQSDTLGSDGDATNNGADLNTTDQKLGTGCLDFETGNGDYINATDLLTNNAMGSTGTISFWIKPESLNGAYMWSVGDSNGTSSRIYIEQQSTSLWTVFCQISGASQWKVDSTGVSFSTGTWYHVVITHDGGSSYGAVKLYINGVDRSSNSNNGSTWNKWVGDLSGLDNMAFGRHHHNNLVYTQKSDGLMDDMGVWNRALTQAEVTSLYNSGTGRTCNTIPSGLRAYYDCNSATVTNNTNAFTAWKERGSA